jgi:hypothetical protein
MTLILVAASSTDGCLAGAEESLSAALGKQRKPDSNHKAEENGGPSAAAKSRSKMRSVERFDMADEKDIDQIELIRTVNLGTCACREVSVPLGALNRSLLCSSPGARDRWR